jgi:cytidylate kinase
MIVTIDGPAGSGKSTAARRLAERLGFHYLDTGAMYRAVALTCLRKGIELADDAKVGAAARRLKISFSNERVFVDDIDVTAAIRTPEVTHGASIVALNTGVREAMGLLQRKLAAGRHVVCEGRDQGTVVFPHAEHKFYFNADATERARRRLRELAEQGDDAPLDDILAQIRKRDERDAQRREAPLRAADDAVHLDTSRKTADEVLELLVETVRGPAGE